MKAFLFDALFWLMAILMISSRQIM